MDLPLAVGPGIRPASHKEARGIESGLCVSRAPVPAAGAVPPFFIWGGSGGLIFRLMSLPPAFPPLYFKQYLRCLCISAFRVSMMGEHGTFDPCVTKPRCRLHFLHKHTGTHPLQSLGGTSVWLLPPHLGLGASWDCAWRKCPPLETVWGRAGLLLAALPHWSRVLPWKEFAALWKRRRNACLHLRHSLLLSQRQLPEGVRPTRLLWCGLRASDASLAGGHILEARLVLQMLSLPLPVRKELPPERATS